MSFFVSANATGAVPCPADTTPSFDLTSTPVIAISSIAVLTTAVSYASVFMHFRNLEYQRQQFHIILILLFPAVYTLFSWLSFALWRGAIAESLLLIRDCYDAVVIYAFYQVLLLYIAPTTAGQKAALVPKRISHPFFPRTRIPMDPSRPTFLSRNKAIVYAFCIGRVLMTFVAIVAEWKGAYCGRINSFKYVHSWYVLVTFSTLLPAIYAIVTLEGLFSRELEGKHIMRKLIAVKGILLVIL
ncbi:organic solute transporter subunit alpha/Transmembrane protein, partial [Chytriomyces sp. MP71]